MTPYYQDDYATIYRGDCREILPQLPKVEWVDGGPKVLLLTDPPYGIGFPSRPTKWQRRKNLPRESWDDEAFTELQSILRFGHVCIIWGGNYYALPQSRGWLAWHKPDAPPSMGSFELAWTNLDRNSRLISHSISATNAERVGHPTQKPLTVISWCITNAPICPAILDPFMGSGTTLVAAKQLGRKAIGIEIEEKYCEIAATRLRNEPNPLFVEKPKQEKQSELL